MQAMPTFEQVASPAGGFRQVRQPSVHSRQVASGGANRLTDAGAGFRRGRSSRSVAIAGVSHSKAATARNHFDAQWLIMS